MEKIIPLIKPSKAEVAYAVGDLSNAKNALEANGYRIASVEEIAKARIEQGRDADVSKFSGWTREGLIYTRKTGMFLTKNSPIMANAKEATDCHRNKNEFYLNQKQLEQAMGDSVRVTDELIPTNRFGENEVTIYLFGKISEKYGEFLKDAGIKEMPIYLTNPKENPFARPLWFGSLDHRSGLDGDCWSLRFDGYGVFGVLMRDNLFQKLKKICKI